MNVADAGVVAVVAISALIGFARGFIREVFGIGAWIGAIVLAIWFHDAVLPPIQRWTDDPAIANPLSYAAIFLPSLIVLSVITGAVGNAVRSSMLGSLDRTMGLAFGVARASLLLAAAYITLGWLQAPAAWPDAVKDARSTPYVYALTIWVVNVLPDRYRPNLVSPPAVALNHADLLQPNPRGRATAARP
jgi:membrane protein required for colicin V production